MLLTQEMKGISLWLGFKSEELTKVQQASCGETAAGTEPNPAHLDRQDVPDAIRASARGSDVTAIFAAVSVSAVKRSCGRGCGVGAACQVFRRASGRGRAPSGTFRQWAGFLRRQLPASGTLTFLAPGRRPIPEVG